MKFDSLSRSGITVKERISIPEDMIPEDAQVEIRAKEAAGYLAINDIPSEDDLLSTKGRAFNE